MLKQLTWMCIPNAGAAHWMCILYAEAADLDLYPECWISLMGCASQMLEQLTWMCIPNAKAADLDVYPEF